MKNKVWILVPVLSLAVVAIIWMMSGTTEKENYVLVKAKKGRFEVIVTVQGELMAKNSINITGPIRARKVGVNQLKISRIVPEGTVVAQGDFVAELDRSEVLTKMKDVELNLQKFESQYTQARLDCTLTLSQARDELINLNYALEQRKLEKEESIYEAPSARRQAEIEFEKAKRNLEQARINYKTKVHQSEAKMREVSADLAKEQAKMEELNMLMEECTINAPEKGMVIYAKEWGSEGRKIGPGSTINTWSPVVATLPDLTVMQSKTFVSEVDIQKVKQGLDVVIGLDADPTKSLKGKVAQVANIGEAQQGSDSKWFEVIIDVITVDSTLRPAMTTGNKILIATIDNAIFIQQECLKFDDNGTYVEVKNGNNIERRPVKTGATNDNEVVILSGLQGGEEILMNQPEKEDPEEDKKKSDSKTASR